MNCSNCQKPVPAASQVCPSCGLQVSHNPYAAVQATQAPPQYTPVHQEGDGTGGVIPYKNPKALIAYYLGIISGLPLIGFPFAVAAFILGILGLRDRKKNPVIKGSAHAWIGIGCGGLFAVLWGGAAIALIVSLIVG